MINTQEYTELHGKAVAHEIKPRKGKTHGIFLHPCIYLTWRNCQENNKQGGKSPLHINSQ